VVCEELNPEQDVETAVRNCIQYAWMPPVKKRDRRNHLKSWNAAGLIQYLLREEEVTGSRKSQGGFTQAERKQAEIILKNLKKPYRRTKNPMVEEIKESLRQKLGNEGFRKDGLYSGRQRQWKTTGPRDGRCPGPRGRYRTGGSNT
jgi:hypothetical protein